MKHIKVCFVFHVGPYKHRGALIVSDSQVIYMTISNSYGVKQGITMAGVGVVGGGEMETIVLEQQ